MVVPRHDEIDITVGRVAELVVAKLARHVGVSPGGYGGGDIVIPRAPHHGHAADRLPTAREDQVGEVKGGLEGLNELVGGHLGGEITNPTDGLTRGVGVIPEGLNIGKSQGGGEAVVHPSVGGVQAGMEGHGGDAALDHADDLAGAGIVTVHGLEAAEEHGVVSEQDVGARLDGGLHRVLGGVKCDQNARHGGIEVGGAGNAVVVPVPGEGAGESLLQGGVKVTDGHGGSPYS